ncbi:LacI family DNA-binding transcriptional regulator [Cytobacillus oceanisediminis]|nr:LacI family DNA-binding transcriptional regulator [Cytobacillus oceanisediminis]
MNKYTEVKKKGFSSRDVASMAGVSQATVSRVMNRPDCVKEETRIRVMQAMERLHYQPNLIARSLVMNSTRTIGLISGNLTNVFFVETTDSIENYVKGQGYKTIIYFEKEEVKLKDIVDSLISQKVDGILLSSIKLNDPIFEGIKRCGIPYVFFNRRPGEEGNYVVLDNELAGQMATSHLLNLGHERIAYISGKLDISTFHERKIGFEKAMRMAGKRILDGLVHFVNPDEGVIGEITGRLMSLQAPPTAILCATDALALSCMDTLMSHGLDVPGDVSLVGIDDTKLSSHQAIQLTSVGHHGFRMGQLAAGILIDLIESGCRPHQDRQIILPPKLVIRKTSGQIRLKK